MHNKLQQQAAEATPVSRVEKTRFARLAVPRRWKSLTASFITHEFSPHSHDTFSIGAIRRLRQVATHPRRARTFGPAPSTINPGEDPATASPRAGRNYRYRMIYPDMAALDRYHRGHDVGGRHEHLSFARQLLIDRPLAAAFNRAHRAIEEGTALEGEEGMYGVLATMFARHGSDHPRPDDQEPLAMRRVKDYIAGHFDEETGLRHWRRWRVSAAPT